MANRRERKKKSICLPVCQENRELWEWKKGIHMLRWSLPNWKSIDKDSTFHELLFHLEFMMVSCKKLPITCDFHQMMLLYFWIFFKGCLGNFNDFEAFIDFVGFWWSIWKGCEKLLSWEKRLNFELSSWKIIIPLILHPKQGEKNVFEFL